MAREEERARAQFEREVREVQREIAVWPRTGASREILEGTSEEEKLRTFLTGWDVDLGYEQTFRFLTMVLEHNSESFEAWLNSANPTHGRRWTLAERKYYLLTDTVRDLLMDAGNRQLWDQRVSYVVRLRRVRAIREFLRDMTFATTIASYR